MTEKIQPLGKLALLRPIKADEMTAGGIALPDTANNSHLRGYVVAVGKDVSSDILCRNVVYPPFEGSVVELDGERHLLIDSEEILAVEVEDD
jgi:chaperonin GroES